MLNIGSPLVSVIVPTKNSSVTLAKCLDSIINQTFKDVEIIIVDNYSSDATLDIARKYTNKIFLSGPERSLQMNYGVEKACGKYIYRVDSDFVLDSNIIEDAVRLAELNNYAGIIIHNTSDETISYWSKVRKFERDMYLLDDLKVAIRFIRKDAFLSLGGFDITMVAGEDYDLHNRLIKKYSIGRVIPKETHIGEYKSIKEVAQKHYYYGKSIAHFLEKNKFRGIKQISPFRAIYIKQYRRFFRHPSLAFGFVIYQAIKYISSLCGILVYIFRRL